MTTRVRGGAEVHWFKDACTTPVALGAADGTGTPLGHGKQQVKAGAGFLNLWLAFIEMKSHDNCLS